MVTNDDRMRNYPKRAELIGAMRPLFKAARRPLTPEWERFGLDRAGWQQLDLVVYRLARHEHFEHLTREQIRTTLRDAVVAYRDLGQAERPQARVTAAETLDTMAQEPLRKTVYLGVEHLSIPDGTVVGDVRFVDPSSDPQLLASFTCLGRAAPSLLCRVEATGGTRDLLLSRARDVAETALGLVRQQHLFGFSAKIYLDQVLYGLDGTWAWADGSTVTRSGWWRTKPRPIPVDFMSPNVERWRAQLAELSDLYLSVPLGLRPRIETCIAWLDVAALTDRWRIIIPAIFTGLEALLVPENAGLKAEAVTVRSLAVHAALEHSLSDPREIMFGYRLRSDLVHGTPTRDVIDKDETDFADSQRRWAFRLLYDYLQLVKTIGADDVGTVVSHLDRGTCNNVCNWLEERGGKAIVDEYRKRCRR